MKKIWLIIFNSLIKLTTNNPVIDTIINWAPLVWLSPGEQFFPLSVSKFLNHVVIDVNKSKLEENTFLRTKENLNALLEKKNSFLYGLDPSANNVPIYAVIKQCSNNLEKSDLNKTLHFHVTYWLFYPYNKGKSVCTLNTRMMTIPIPKVDDQCVGDYQEFGNHVGEWEHLSLLFEGNDYPSTLYISTHDVGAYYKYNHTRNEFHYKKSDYKRTFQRPIFPPVLSTYDNHPIVFAAFGSHGLWASPGKYRYIKIPYLYDITGYGFPWYTWKNVEIVDKSIPKYYWAHFKGKWGNKKQECHPLSIFIANMCKYVDGPTGVYTKKDHFTC